MFSIKIKQRDITDCGAACLASVAAFYRLSIPVAKIRQLAGTDNTGTNILGMVEAASGLGFDARGVRAGTESLTTIPLPAIAHIKTRNGLLHFIVITKVKNYLLELMDPSDGKIHKRSVEDFSTNWTGILVLMTPTKHFSTGNHCTSNVKRFYQLIKPHRLTLLMGLIGALLYTVLGLSTAVFIQKITDQVLIAGDRNQLNTMSMLMIGMLLLQVLIGVTKTVMTMRTGQKIDAALIMGYYKHLMCLPQRFFDTMRVGEIISRVNDAVKIRTLINDLSVNLSVNLFIVLFSFALMFSYYWKLALIMVLVIPLYTAIYLISDKMNKQQQRRLMEESAELESQLVESLNAIGTIKRFGIEKYTNNQTEYRFLKLLQTIYKAGIANLFSSTSTETVARLITIILLWTGAGYILDARITPGELFSFYALIGYFTGPAAALVGANKSIREALIASDRLFEIMDLNIEQQNLRTPVMRHEIGNIRFEKVTFRYGADRLIFHELNLEISAGSFTAIVGESGSGKSTMMSLLQNIYPLLSGQIYIGKHAISDLNTAMLRKFVNVVPQQIDIFSGNVIENIALGETQPDIDRIMDICTDLGIHSFIEQLPDGFYTQLGENGSTLSGGQKQRIAIARALYVDPEILILDEATSSLDSRAEQFVHRSIDLLRSKNKTVIIIAHRLTTIQQADKVIVLNKGKVVQQGKHLILLSQEGAYADLWAQQFGGVNNSTANFQDRKSVLLN